MYGELLFNMGPYITIVHEGIESHNTQTEFTRALEVIP